MKSDRREELAEEISTQVDRTSSLVRRLSELDSDRGIDTGAVDVNGSIRTCASIIENQLKLDDVELNLDLSENLPLAAAEPDRLTHAINNLKSNAREAIGRQVEKGLGRTIAIRTVFESSQVKLLITDRDTGIPSHLKDRIFEQFYTTNASGRGPGPSISREIIWDFHDHIKVHTDSMQSAAFVVSLPAFQAEEPDPYRSAANQRIAPED